MPLYCDCTCYKISFFFNIEFGCMLLYYDYTHYKTYLLLGPSFLKRTKSYHNITNFLYFLSNLFLPCKNTFMNDLKYDTCQI